jgi:hypothetical protein
VCFVGLVIGVFGSIAAGNEAYKNCHQWLSPPDPSTNHNNASTLHHEGTAAWFIYSETFEKWKANGSLLWIYGKRMLLAILWIFAFADGFILQRVPVRVCSGACYSSESVSRSSLSSSAIIKDIQDLYKTGSDFKLAYFYCDFRDSAKQHAHGLLSSLIMQLSAQSTSCHDITSRFYSAHKEGLEQPKSEVLMECFMKMLCLPGQDLTYIIIDALDECPSSGIPSPREEILEVVRKLVDSDISNLHICLTSRPEPDIHNVLQPMSPCCICLHEERGQVDDMAAYVRWVIDSDPKIRKWRASDKALVIETLSQKGCGMWVILLVHAFDLLMTQ